MKYLKFLQQNLVYVIPVVILFGIVFGYYFETDFLKKAILPITFVMIYPQMVNLNINKLVERANFKLKLVSLILNFLLLPALAFGLGKVFFANSPMDAVGLFIMALLPTGSMTIAFTGMTKGNLPAAIRISIFSLLLAAFLAPIYLVYFMGESIEINFWMVTKKILLVIVAPLIFGAITRYFVIKKIGEKDYKEKFGQKIGLFSSLGVVAMIFSSIAMKANYIVENPLKIVTYLLPLFIFYIVAFTISTIVGKKLFSKADTLALVFGTSLRHLAIALAVAVTSFGEKGFEIALIISIAFVFQIKIGAWYVKLADKILKK